jgi:hypothetical protein
MTLGNVYFEFRYFSGASVAHLQHAASINLLARNRLFLLSVDLQATQLDESVIVSLCCRRTTLKAEPNPIFPNV